jgi:hypothetical protein
MANEFTMKTTVGGYFSIASITLLLLAGCAGPSITAVRLSPGPREPEGIPYYLPKPYLFVTKNFYYIPAPTVGLTATVPIPGSFDTSNSSKGGGNQPNTNNASNTKQPNPKVGGATNLAQAYNPFLLPADGQPLPIGLRNASLAGGNEPRFRYASINAAAIPSDEPGDDPPQTNNATEENSKGSNDTNPVSSNVSTSNGGQITWAYPGTNLMIPAPASDGFIPQEYFTYQIVYLPDLTQKYGLRIHGGHGELRATENLVNGWMHTGPGPFYTKNSSSAETATAVGQATGTIVDSVAKGIVSGLVPSGAAASAASSALKAVATAGQEGGATNNLTQITNYAILYVYEPILDTTNNTVSWQLILTNAFNRDVAGMAGTGTVTDTTDANADFEKTISDAITGASPDIKFTSLTVTVNPPVAGGKIVTVNIAGQAAKADGSALSEDALKSLKAAIPQTVVNTAKKQGKFNLTASGVDDTGITAAP